MKSNLRRKSFALVATAAMLVASFFVVQHARGESAKPFAPELKIDNFTFTVPSVTVAAGTEVTWVNRDDIPHTVVSQEGVFKSKALDTDDKFSFKFSQPGTYHYFCSIHPKMTAEVVVK